MNSEEYVSKFIGTSEAKVKVELKPGVKHYFI